MGSLGGTLPTVGRIDELAKAVEALSDEELAAFRTWFAQFDAAAWDAQIEADVRAGKLDALADEAIDDLAAGKCTDR